MTGEMSMPPRSGRMRRIGRSRLGDPPQKIPDHGDERLCRLTTPKATSQLSTAWMIKQPDIDRDHRVDEVQKRVHSHRNLGGQVGGDRSLRRRGPQASGATPRERARRPPLTAGGAPHHSPPHPARVRIARWGRSSAGRASRSQCEGQGFDPPRLHHPPRNGSTPPAAECARCRSGKAKAAGGST